MIYSIFDSPLLCSVYYKGWNPDSSTLINNPMFEPNIIQEIIWKWINTSDAFLYHNCKRRYLLLLISGFLQKTRKFKLFSYLALCMNMFSTMRAPRRHVEEWWRPWRKLLADSSAIACWHLISYRSSSKPKKKKWHSPF